MHMSLFLWILPGSVKLNFNSSFIDAEPKYLIAVQPIPTNEVKKQCTGNAYVRIS